MYNFADFKFDLLTFSLPFKFQNIYIILLANFDLVSSMVNSIQARDVGPSWPFCFLYPGLGSILKLDT